MPHVSQGGGTNSQVTVTQSISPGPSMGPGSAGNQGMLNQQNPNRNNVMQNVTTNIGTSGMDPRRGQPGQINPPPMVGTGSGEPAPGMTGTLPGVGADCMVNRTVVWRGKL